MKQITISAIAFQDEGTWIAQGIEYDIAVSAETLSKVRKAFEKVVIANVCVNRKLGRSGLDGIPPAPQHFHDLFNNADMDIHQIKNKSTDIPVEISDFRLAEVV